MLWPASYANHLGTSVRNAFATTLCLNGRYLFKHLTLKEVISSNFWTVTFIHLYLWTLIVAYGYNILVILICFALELPELSSTIHPLANTDSGSSLRRTFHDLVVYTLLNLSDIFCIIVGGLTTIEIWEGTQLLTSSYSLNSTAELFPLKKISIYRRFPILRR